jgi:hypothetical protein
MCAYRTETDLCPETWCARQAAKHKIADRNFGIVAATQACEMTKQGWKKVSLLLQHFVKHSFVLWKEFELKASRHNGWETLH